MDMFSALWLVVIILAQGPASANTPTFKVSGTIVREDKREPDAVPNSDRILLRGNGTSSVLDIEAGGAFEFTRVRPGNYELVVGPMITMDPLKFVVTDKDVTGVRVVVPDLVVIRGTVLVDDEGPHPHFQMTFSRIDAPATAPVNATIGTTFTTMLSPGTYRTAASGLPRGYSIKSIGLGTAEILAESMKLTSGDSPSLTITLGVASPPPWVRVRGHVSGSSSAATTNSVALIGSGLAETPIAALLPDGSFEFPRVLPGSYTARTFPPSATSASGTLNVGTEDVANFELRPPLMKEISGKIAIKGAVPMPRLAFSLTSGGATAMVPANPLEDGSFTVSLPEGENQISIAPGSIPSGYLVSSFIYGATDLLKKPLRVTLSDTARLNVGINASAVTPVNVSGHVTGLLTTKGVRVVLMNPLLASAESAVDPHGSFRFSKVIPGTYNVRLSLSGVTPATGLTVSTKDVTNLVISYTREFIVTGHVLIEGGGSTNISQLMLDAKPRDGKTTTATVNNNGVIMLNVKDGEYNISARDVPAGYRVQSIMYGTTDLQKEPLKIDGPVTWEIILRLIPEK
jgi:hypothetical protein